MRWTYLLSITLLLGGCTMLARVQMDRQYGNATPQNRLMEASVPATIDYWHDVKPILESRCVVCHGCYDAPCQLKMSAYEGIERGASQEKVYDTRVLAAIPNRLFVDARLPSQWRERGYYPVLNERSQTNEANINAGVMARMLLLKHQHPLPDTTPLPNSFDFSLDRKQLCPTIEKFDSFARKRPLWGMPYGLPGLADSEHSILIDWLKQGAPYYEPPALPPTFQARIDKWEIFLNGDTLKQQLMSRYLYEHLFLANLYFSDLSTQTFFRLVRSKSPPGVLIDLIATRRPYDNPETERVYYRLQAVRTTILEKTHMPYAFNTARMLRYRELFLEPNYEVQDLPSYDPDVAANPFITFEAIPANSRYRFLIDEARFTIMNFIKGPVCRGQIALNVIDDQFWIVFLNPNSRLLKNRENFLSQELRNLELPTEKQSNTLLLSTWVKYAARQAKYLNAKMTYMQENLSQPDIINLDLVWDGDGWNQNAALTIFRHFDSASVVKGLVGDPPKTAWIIDYPLLERIYYLLVAGFDIYGNVGHQLNTRLYMDFLRMEGEFNFLTLLPRDRREEEWNYWYRGADENAKNYIHNRNVYFNQQTDIIYKTDDPKSELYTMLRQHLGGALNNRYAIEGEDDTYIRKYLTKLSRLQGEPVNWLPQTAFLSIEDHQDDGQQKVYTLNHNNGLSNVSQLVFEKFRRLPSEDTLTVSRDFIGAYPGAFYRVARENLPDFIAAVSNLASEKDYHALVSRFGVRRTDPDFWAHSDMLHAAYKNSAPIEAGLFDYNRLENR